jgi:hypothetical protein
MLVEEPVSPRGLILTCGTVLVGLATTSRGAAGAVVPIPTLPLEYVMPELVIVAVPVNTGM